MIFDASELLCFLNMKWRLKKIYWLYASKREIMNFVSGTYYSLAEITEIARSETLVVDAIRLTVTRLRWLVVTELIADQRHLQVFLRVIFHVPGAICVENFSLRPDNNLEFKKMVFVLFQRCFKFAGAHFSFAYCSQNWKI